ARRDVSGVGTVARSVRPARSRPHDDVGSRSATRPSRSGGRKGDTMKDALGAVQSVVVLGGGSAIGRAITLALVRGRARTIVLAGRHLEGMKAVADDLVAAGATNVSTVAFDATDPSGHETALAECWEKAGGDVDVVLVAFGILGRQDEAELDLDHALE